MAGAAPATSRVIEYLFDLGGEDGVVNGSRAWFCVELGGLAGRGALREALV